MTDGQKAASQGSGDISHYSLSAILLQASGGKEEASSLAWGQRLCLCTSLGILRVLMVAVYHTDSFLAFDHSLNSMSFHSIK